jgi:hypothetical protein
MHRPYEIIISGKDVIGDGITPDWAIHKVAGPQPNIHCFPFSIFLET